MADKKRSAGGANGLVSGGLGRATMVSVALHAVLALGLVSLRFAGEPGFLSAARVVRVDLVSLPTDAAPQNAAPAPPGDAPTPDPRTAIVGAEPGTRPEPPEAAPPPSLPPRTVEPEVAPDALPTVAVLTPPTPAEPTFPEPLAVVVAEEVAAAQVPTPAEPEAGAASQTIAMDAAQLDMIDRRLTELTARLDVVTERQDVEWRHGGQTYNATLEHVPAADSMGIDEIKVTVTTEQNGQRLSTELGMRRLAFSSFAQFVDRWDPSVRAHDDEIDGRFHSNSEINIIREDGVQPVFRGKVTTAARIDTSSSERSVRRADVFLGGLETYVPKIWLPKRSQPLPDGRDDARVHELSQAARITFYADGSYGWTYVESVAAEERMIIGAEPHYLVAPEKAVLYLKGTVNGKVLVYSPAGIVIEDDLVYAAHPAISPESDDYLGLVSERSVEIAEPSTTGPGDITVHAAIFAKGSFTVRNFRTSGLATLTVYGSVAAGWISATEPRFRTKLRFDERLTNLRPPSFPLTDRYELAAWDGRWILDTE